MFIAIKANLSGHRDIFGWIVIHLNVFTIGGNTNIMSPIDNGNLYSPTILGFVRNRNGMWPEMRKWLPGILELYSFPVSEESFAKLEERTYQPLVMRRMADS